MTNINHELIQKKILSSKSMIARSGDGYTGHIFINSTSMSIEDKEYLSDAFIGKHTEEGFAVSIVDNNHDLIVFENEEHAKSSLSALSKSLQKKYMYHAFQKDGISLKLQTNRISITVVK